MRCCLARLSGHSVEQVVDDRVPEVLLPERVVLLLQYQVEDCKRLVQTSSDHYILHELAGLVLRILPEDIL